MTIFSRAKNLLSKDNIQILKTHNYGQIFEKSTGKN